VRGPSNPLPTSDGGAPPLRRRAAWAAFWALLFAFAFGCGGGTVLDSLRWTTATPATGDLVGEWAPSASMEETLRLTWGVRSAPLRIVLGEDGTATVRGFDLLVPGTREWDAAQSALASEGTLAESAATWRVVADPDGWQQVLLTAGERVVSLQMWSSSRPYSLSTYFDDADPDYGHYLFFTRRADDEARSALAPTTAPPPSSVAGGDGLFEMAVRIVFWTVALILGVCLAVAALLVLAVAVVVTIVIVIAACVALAAGGALGIAVTSALVAIARRSVAAGFRTLLTLVAAVPGALLGAVFGWGARRMVQGPSPEGTVLDLWIVGGLLVGAVLGGLAGRFVAIAVEHAARWVIAKLSGRPAATAAAA
jgi:hypothetical protein